MCRTCSNCKQQSAYVVSGVFKIFLKELGELSHWPYLGAWFIVVPMLFTVSGGLCSGV